MTERFVSITDTLLYSAFFNICLAQYDVHIISSRGTEKSQLWLFFARNLYRNWPFFSTVRDDIVLAGCYFFMGFNIEEHFFFLFDVRW